MKLGVRIVCLLLFVPLVAAAGKPRSSDAEHWATIFDDPDRKTWQKPRTVLAYLGIQQGDIVADIGAGTGYFTSKLSYAVGEKGKVYAVDIEQAMLDHLQARDDILPQRVTPVLAKKNDPMLPDGEIDLILIVNTWHHIKKRTTYLEVLRQSLSPQGRIALIDFRAGELPVGPPPKEKLSHEQVLAEFDEVGWRLVGESVALPYQYFMVFLPPEQIDERRFLNR